MNRQIPFNKTRFAVAMVISIAFAAIGILMFMRPEYFDAINLGHDLLLKIGIFLSILFITVLVFTMLKLTNSSMGLVINEEGIQDNAGGLNFGLIKWEQIIAFGTKKHLGNTNILIYVKNEEELINRLGKIKKRLVNENMKVFDTPVAISLTMLKPNSSELLELFKQVAREKGVEFKD
jgi:predicted ferric reductase